MKRNLLLVFAPLFLLTACTYGVSEKTISLNEINSSGQTGTAVFSEVDGKAVVKVTLSGGTKDIPSPIHLHEGSCGTLGGIKHSLNDVLNETSETTLSVDMETLKSQLPLAVNAHTSYEDVGNIACGDVSL